MVNLAMPERKSRRLRALLMGSEKLESFMSIELAAGRKRSSADACRRQITAYPPD
jgi:hypothetical protein